jgi:hypothetical protein
VTIRAERTVSCFLEYLDPSEAILMSAASKLKKAGFQDHREGLGRCIHDDDEVGNGLEVEGLLAHLARFLQKRTLSPTIIQLPVY